MRRLRWASPRKPEEPQTWRSMDEAAISPRNVSGGRWSSGGDKAVKRCLFALKTDKAGSEAGDRPSIEIAASNPTDKPADATVWISILATRPTSPLSRMLPTPRSLWSRPQAFRLKARETKTVTIVSEASLPGGEKISITMSDRNEAILARSLGVRNGPATASQSSPAAKAARTEP